MNVYEQQRDILFEACKKVATDQKCPKWIADILRDAVMKAKQTKEDFPTLDNSSETPAVAVPLQIGDNVVIGAGSVVTKDIPANVIAAGNPCRVIRPITDEDRKYFYKKREFDIQL